MVIYLLFRVGFGEARRCQIFCICLIIWVCRPESSSGDGVWSTAALLRMDLKNTAYQDMRIIDKTMSGL
ncbi:hypothetical protein INR49_017774 [Caranx melampygus]|nr:hypothetical protein INR49_017774 [Caranx melampygus]